MNFMGYRRRNGNVGVRNHVLVFPTTICASAVAEMIGKEVAGIVSVAHRHGCGHLGEEEELMVRTMAGFCANPNVAGVLLIGLGCEQLTPELIAKRLSGYHQRFEILNIQEEGGTINSVARGSQLARQLVAEAAAAKREPVPASELIVGTNCGGSDTISGVTANPSLGVASDLIISEGGTVIVSETPEMIGAEQVLARRAANAQIRRRIRTMIAAAYANIKARGVDVLGAEPSPGNIAGGLTTLEEKSLGAVLKCGTAPVVQVIDFAQKPNQKGLIIMDGPAHDVVCNSGLLAAGAQLIVFTTGRGTPIGAPIAPVLKVSSNSALYHRMKDNIDLNAGTILDGTESIQAVGERILQEIIAVASGGLTSSEVLGHLEFAIPSIIPTI
jgi:altronate dehydratase large subunit